MKNMTGFDPKISDQTYLAEMPENEKSLPVFDYSEGEEIVVPLDELLVDGLSTQQKTAFYRITSWVSGNGFDSESYENSPCYFLRGAAGTGKSFLSAKILRWVIAELPDLKICVICPSHKAKRNIKAMLTAEGLDSIGCRSIASYLGQAPKLNKKTGLEEFVSIKSLDELDSYDLVVVDEAPMASKANITAILNRPEQLILFMGDLDQLPPVGEKMSCLVEMPMPTSFLFEVVRYTGDILKICTSYRIDSTARLPIKPINETSIIQHSTRISWLAAMAKKLVNGEDFKGVCFRNATAIKWNGYLLEEAYGQREKFAVGNRLLAKKPLQRENTYSLSRNDEYEVIAENGMEFVITGEPLPMHLMVNGIELKWWQFRAQPDDGAEISCRVLHDDDQLKLKKLVDGFRAEKDWKNLKKYALMFDDLVHSYVVTCHKSQGSTYESVFLDMVDLILCDDSRAIIYTALSRASKEVHV
jgi:AAA domain/UvrD-like helicase C-terminal domain